MKWKRRKSGLIVPKGVSRRAFLAGLVTAPAIWPSEARARFVLNQLTGFGGRAPAVGLPASVTLSDSIAQTSAGGSGTVGTVQLGAVDATRATIITAAVRSDSASGTVTATLDGNSMTSVEQIFANSGQNPTAMLILDTGAGSALAAATSANLVIGGLANLQRVSVGVLRALNLASLTPFATNSTNVNTNLSMTIQKKVDGITIVGSYDGANTSNSWVNMDNNQSIWVSTGHLNQTAWEDTDADETPASINLTTPVGNTQRGAVAASWAGASNP